MGGNIHVSGRKIRIDNAVKGSMWMSLVATPSVKDGFDDTMVSSGRVVMPNGV